ncbi:Putative E3 ubiquitin-protein ligase [Yamadazyma tenuis]|nr:Putative E3 ubiquitin-protein ligase [Yamadazyma tenuis]
MKDSHVPHTISFRYVKRVAEKCLADAHDNQHKTLHEIFEPLSNYLYTAFQNYGCVNNSFKVKKSSSKIHYSTSNINYEDIQKVFDLLTKLPTKRPLYNALQGCSTLLRRIPVSFGEDARNYCFLLIMFQIPLLSHALTHYESKSNPPCTRMIDSPEIKALCYDVIKRVLGILSNIKSVRVKNYITSWFSRYSSSDFVSKVDLINVYITFHMKKYFYIANNPEHRRKLSIPSPGNNVDEEYFQNSSFKEQIEQMNSGSSPLPTGPLNFGRTKSKKSKDSTTKIRIYQYGNDWHLKTASIVLQSFLEAYNIRADSLHVSIFYNSLVDYVNLKMDFDSWISNKKFKDQKPGDNPELSVVIDYINGNQNSFASSATFFFSKYPFLITLGNKISILEYEAKRIMERKAEEAFINSLDRRVPLDVYFRVRVRRSHFVQDSLNCILANQQNLKKSLKVQFVGEAGIDAGGLRKEWFLLLTKAMLSPETGMLVNVEESNYHWFNLVPINNVDNYYLFGAVLGLAVYNSTILELNFPIAFYKMLLKIPLGFSDFEQLHPDLSRNLFKIKSLSDEELNMLDLSFEISIFDLFHNVVNRELVPDGKNIQVTSKNRDLYIEKYAKFRLTDGVAEQTDSLLKGFCSVTSGNGLSLFSPEEIQLLLCGNEEGKLDLEILRSVTKYLGWKDSEEAQNSQLINWLWEYLNELSYKEQKKFLSFVTGSDRIPATGIQNLNLTIKKAGSESERLPTAHTCFNELEIHRYATKEKLYEKLSMAIQGSSGFGIK